MLPLSVDRYTFPSGDTATSRSRPYCPTKNSFTLSTAVPEALSFICRNFRSFRNATNNDLFHNSPTAFDEIGCIHTTQGYDLNYTGVIFGKEINYNTETEEIEINPKLYFDINGKKGISEIKDLKAYIINIYKTIMYRGIKGTFIYACNKELRDYLKENIETYKKGIPFRILPFEDVIPYVNSVPLVDITTAAGNFSDLQVHSDLQWIELPIQVSVKEG